MSEGSRRHVVQGDDGKWKVKGEGAGRASSSHDTQKQAIAASDRIVHNAGDGETAIHGRDGKIRDSKTIAPGNEPYPPRDTK